VIVVEIQIYYREIIIRNIISKLFIISLLSKNKNSAKMRFKSRQVLDEIDNSSLKNYITKTQKQPKIVNSSHKLHRLHSHI